MYFVILGTDRPGSAELRMKTRPVHREYLHRRHDGIELKLSGPTLADDGKTMTGSLIVVEADDRKTVEEFAAQDPFRLADLFERFEIRCWDWSTGNPDKR